jgi:DeoR/GlpR family transcriptional regulator of sugar metabolism
MSKLTKVTSVSAEELAELFGVTDRTIRQLAEDGIALRIGHGRYDAEASTTNYIRHLQNTIVFRAMGIYDK